MKTHISRHPKATKPGANPITLHDLKIGPNNHGHFCVTFGSAMHKYLDVTGTALASHVEGVRCEHGMARVISVKTQETWFDKEFGMEVPEDELELFLIPESQEEYRSLQAVLSVLPTKWAYSLCFVPYEDFYPSEA